MLVKAEAPSNERFTTDQIKYFYELKIRAIKDSENGESAQPQSAVQMVDKTELNAKKIENLLTFLGGYENLATIML